MPKGFNVQEPLSIDPVDGSYRLIKVPSEAITQNLRFLVLTAPGERIRVPSFGVGLRNYLFENYTQALANNLRQKILEQAQIFMPYITITNIEIDDSAIDSNQLTVGIHFEANSTIEFSDFLLLTVTI